MIRSSLYLPLIVAVHILIRPIAGNAQAPNPLTLYYAGKIDEARLGYETVLKQELETNDALRLWQSYMAFAWFEEQVGRHGRSIELSNQALLHAVKLRDNFRIGRSLCWLGWSYESIGLYELALRFFEEAKKLGEDEASSRIVHVAVWGLATQEIGALYFKMGDLPRAKEYLNKTYAYAQKNDIQVGVAEGGRHLAEIALVEGELEQAERYADAAVLGAKKCNCSPLNTTRALVTRARVLLDMNKGKHRVVKREVVVTALNEALAEAEKTQNIASIAESKLLLSQTIPMHDFSKRYELVSAALELLVTAENELRGSAEAELGAVFVAHNQFDLAKFYLNNGLQINQELFRVVDNAYVLASLSDLEKVQGRDRDHLEALERAANHAESVGALPLAVEKRLELLEALDRQGYDQLAIRSAQLLLATVDRSLKIAESNLLREKLARAQLKATELLAKYGIRLVSSMPPPA